MYPFIDYILTIRLLLHPGGGGNVHCLLGGLHRRARLRTLQASHWDLNHTLEPRRLLLSRQTLFAAYHDSLVV